MAHPVHQAQLYGSLGKHHRTGAGETFQAIQAANEDVVNAPVLSFSYQPQPKLCAFRLHHPQAHHLFHTVQVDANRPGTGLEPDRALAPRPDVGAVHEDDGYSASRGRDCQA